MRTLTDGGLYDHCIRIRRILAVSGSIDSLHPEYIFLSGGQTVTHKPKDRETLMRLISFNSEFNISPQEQQEKSFGPKKVHCSQA